MKSLLGVLLSAVLAGTASAASLGLAVGGGAQPGDVITIDIVAEIAAGDPITLGIDLRLAADGGIRWTGSTQTALTSNVFPPRRRFWASA